MNYRFSIKFLVIFIVAILTIANSTAMLADNELSETKQNANYTSEVDISSYVRNIQQTINKNWQPPLGTGTKNVVVLFSIDRNGRVFELKIKKSSKDNKTDEAALVAVNSSSPFGPLPDEYVQDKMDIEFIFDYKIWETLSNSQMSFNQYLKNLQDRMFAKWGLLGASKQLKTTIVFDLGDKGDIINPEILYSSGDNKFDNLALKTVKDVSPFYELPVQNRGQLNSVRATFSYSDKPAVYLTREQGEEISPTFTPLEISCDMIPEVFNARWKGNIVTPDVKNLPFNIKKENQQLYVFIGSKKYLTEALNVINNKDISFVIDSGTSPDAKIKFIGKISDTSINGTAFDISGKEGYWFLNKVEEEAGHF